MNLTYSLHFATFLEEGEIHRKREQELMNDREKIRLTEMVSGAG